MRICLSVALALLCCSCHLPSQNVQAPTESLPKAFSPHPFLVERITPTESRDVLVMHNELDAIFGDSTLTHLLEIALLRNTDVAIAKERIIQAQASRDAAWGNLLPTLNASASAGKNHDFKNNNSNADSTTKNIGANLAWEIDLFGKNTAAKNAAEQHYFATLSNLQNTQLALLAEVCNNYFLLQNIALNLEISRVNLELYAQILDAVRLMTEAGTLDSTYLFDAQDDLTNAQIAYEQLKTSRVAARNALLVLLDQKSLPQLPAMSHKPLPKITLLSELPASVILQRPDIKAQIHTLYAAAYNADSAQAALFPTLSLNGSLQSALQSPTTFTGQILASLTAPLLNRAALNAQVESTRSLLRENESLLRNAINTALSEIDNALFDVQSNQEQLAYAKQRLRNAEEYFSFFSARYEIGLINSREYYSNQVSLNNAQIAINETYLRNLQSYITLFKAFGGQINAQN